MEKYVTLVFKAENHEQYKKIRAMALEEICKAWSLDHELLRGDLMRKAIENDDLKKAEEYASADGVIKYRGDLDEPKIKAVMNA